MMGNGNVGVGTSNPSEKLEVNGTIKAQGLKLNNLNIQYEAASSQGPEKIIWGKDDNMASGPIGAPLFPSTCIDPLNIERVNVYNGGAVYKVKSLVQNSGLCSASDPTLYVGLYGCNGAIETNQIDDNGNQAYSTSKLLINTLCGKDVVVGNSNGGNLIVNHNLGIGVLNPNQKLEVNGNGLITGTLGIGTNTPQGVLDIKTDVNNNVTIGSAAGSSMNWGTSYIGFNASRNGNTWTVKGDNANNGGNIIYTNAVGDLMFCNFGTTGGTDQTFSDQTVVSSKIKMKLTADGRFGLGVDPNLATFYNYKFVVNGKIRCRGIRMDNDNWADYVFDNSYDLLSINALELFVKTNKHLPHFLSEKQIKEEGLDLEKTLLAQQKTIEELVLYVIKLNKEIEALKK